MINLIGHVYHEDEVIMVCSLLPSGDSGDNEDCRCCWLSPSCSVNESTFSSQQYCHQFNHWPLQQFNLTLFQFTYVIREIHINRVYRRSIVKKRLLPRWARKIIRLKLKSLDYEDELDIVVNFKVNDCHTVPIDKAGNQLFLPLVSTKLKVEEGLSLLSTLGGAFSALGDRYLHFAIRAGMTSLKQIRLACITGDPSIIARCSIYMVYSLCQRGLRKRARRLMRNFIHPYITQMILKKTCDTVLRNMYKAAQFRIEYYYN